MLNNLRNLLRKLLRKLPRMALLCSLSHLNILLLYGMRRRELFKSLKRGKGELMSSSVCVVFAATGWNWRRDWRMGSSLSRSLMLKQERQKLRKDRESRRRRRGVLMSCVNEVQMGTTVFGANSKFGHMTPHC